MTLHIDWLGEERMIEIDVLNSVKVKGGSISSNVTLFSCSYCFIYSITIAHTEQYINTCNHNQACPHDACSICLVLFPWHLYLSRIKELLQNVGTYKKQQILVQYVHK